MIRSRTTGFIVAPEHPMGGKCGQDANCSMAFVLGRCLGEAVAIDDDFLPSFIPVFGTPHLYNSFRVATRVGTSVRYNSADERSQIRKDKYVECRVFQL